MYLMQTSKNQQEIANAEGYLRSISQIDDGAANPPRKPYWELRKEMSANEPGKMWYLFEVMPEGLGYVVLHTHGKPPVLKGPFPYDDIAQEKGWEDTVADREEILAGLRAVEENESPKNTGDELGST